MSPCEAHYGIASQNRPLCCGQYTSAVENNSNLYDRRVPMRFRLELAPQSKIIFCGQSGSNKARIHMRQTHLPCREPERERKRECLKNTTTAIKRTEPVPPIVLPSRSFVRVCLACSALSFVYAASGLAHERNAPSKRIYEWNE